MELSVNETRERALKFAVNWKDTTSERGEAQSFWNDFFYVFGLLRRKVATFEKPVIKVTGKLGYIDLFWKGVLVVEHKSKGNDLEKAYSQAIDYFAGLPQEDLPRYVLVSDFAQFKLYDLDTDTNSCFALEKLHENIHLFNFFLDQKNIELLESKPIDKKAVDLMIDLNNELEKSGYKGHVLRVFLVRILYCLFADDIGIWNRGHFYYYLNTKTKEDGSDLGIYLLNIFDTLDTPISERQDNIDEDLNKFTYLNGTLFKERLRFPSFNSKMRESLLSCCNYKWRSISPEIFGSLFQLVINKSLKQHNGTFYTSEENIIKVIKPLFLDELYTDFMECNNNEVKLLNLLKRIKQIRLLDPACGCGNFLIVSYRELRILEKEILIQLRRLARAIEDFDFHRLYDGINVDNLYGIEIEEFPCKVAEVAIWLVDHQMNIEFSEEFGIDYNRIPLRIKPNIVTGNALRIKWQNVISSKELSYIVGNPPFVSKNKRTSRQKEDMEIVCSNIKKYGELDYVCAWFIKAVEYIKNETVKIAFVSTNSICQGEQVSRLWEYLLAQNIIVNFAHRTFKWSNEAKGNASVFVIIIGFSKNDVPEPKIFNYETPVSIPSIIIAKNINPYLVDHENIIIKKRKKSINTGIPIARIGSKPIDNNNYLFNDQEKDEFLLQEPYAEKFFKPFISARKFISGENRWCLWLKEATPSELKRMKKVSSLLDEVRNYRLKSKRKRTNQMADLPAFFAEDCQPDNSYIVIPRHTSVNRKYLPTGILSKEFIVNDSCILVPNFNYYHFGIINSTMHQVWFKTCSGRIKGDCRYSVQLVYNTFPFPINPNTRKKELVTKAVEDLLNIRKELENESLLNLYNPKYTPKKLINAHRKLDLTVEKCYRAKKFENDNDRFSFLYQMYASLLK